MVEQYARIVQIVDLRRLFRSDTPKLELGDSIGQVVHFEQVLVTVLAAVELRGNADELRLQASGD